MEKQKRGGSRRENILLLALSGKETWQKGRRNDRQRESKGGQQLGEKRG